MKSYQDLLRKVLSEGVQKEDRTGTGTTSLFGPQIEIDLKKGFPLLTTKRVFWKGVVEELLWFLRGEVYINSMQKKGVHIWDPWADKRGYVGPVYGAQWRSWRGYYLDDYHYEDFDQITDVINKIKSNPTSRRLIVSAWNVGELNAMALPPCHMIFQFYVANGELSCKMFQRSCDAFIGLPFNIASYALLTHMVANECELSVSKLILTFGDIHVYSNHMEQVQEQLSREPRPLPSIELAKKKVLNMRYDDIKLLDYNPHPGISAKVAV